MRLHTSCCVLCFALLLSGCITEREAIITYYTQADVDAITMRLQCQRLARNSFQLSLCDPVRR